MNGFTGNNGPSAFSNNCSNITSLQSPSSIRQNVPNSLRTRNKMWCETCRRVFSCLDTLATEGPCPYCRTIGHSLLNANNLRASPSHPNSTEYVQPISRPFHPSTHTIFNSNGDTSAFPTITTQATIPPSSPSATDSFTVTFLRRTMRRLNGTIVSETLIPVVHLNPFEVPELSLPMEHTENNNQASEQNQNEETNLHNNSHQPPSEPIAPASNGQMTRLMRLAQIVNRLFTTLQNASVNGEDHDDSNWTSQMDEGQNLDSFVQSSNFPFIIFAVGNSSPHESPDFSEMIENFFAGRSQGKAPASANAINKLDNFYFGDPIHTGLREECAICQCDYKLGDRLLKLPCAHDYHKDCVVEWLQQHDSCPICRRSIESETQCV